MYVQQRPFEEKGEKESVRMRGSRKMRSGEQWNEFNVRSAWVGRIRALLHLVVSGRSVFLPASFSNSSSASRRQEVCSRNPPFVSSLALPKHPENHVSSKNSNSKHHV